MTTPAASHLMTLAQDVHRVARSKGYWDHEFIVVRDPVLGDVEGRPKNPSILPEKLALIHTEVAEATEAWRDGDRKKMGLELCDVLGRTLELFVPLGLNPDELWTEKMRVVQGRPALRRWSDRLV
jgi:NTP pyrophosphatase (non-canonical NTP hydrolase)